MVSGGGTNLQAIIDNIETGRIKNARVVLVLSTNAKAYALERAKNHGIEGLVLAKKNFASDADREDALYAELSERNIDLVVFSGCLMILSAGFIAKWGKPIINIHPSYLPDYGGKGLYGLAPHEAVLAAGEVQTGATVHYIDGGIDTGDIIIQKRVAVKEGDTPETLQKRVMEEAEWQILPEAVAMFANGRLP
jgi:phosphoribosylglycinamide formyltransferase-1